MTGTDVHEGAIAGALPAMAIGSFHERLLFHTNELDEAREKVTALYTRHRLDFIGRDRRLDTYFYHVPLLRASVNCLGYGSDMVIEPGDLQNFFLVQTPVRGMTHAVCGAQSIHSDPNLGSVLSPSVPVRMSWRANCWQVQVRLERALLEQALANALERPLGEPIMFELGMDMRSPAGISWWNTVRHVAEQAHLAAALPHGITLLRQLEQLLVNSLLYLQPHNYTEQLLNREPCILPRHVKRAEEYIAAHYNENITIEDLAAHCGVSPRSLYRGFQEFRNISPMQHLKTTRLEMAHRMLKVADPSDSVTRIALDAGFRQLGRFAVEYRRRFGECPSETLKS
ncbi:MAG: HTH-type transcriptional activator RhaS [Pseudomonadales bacterium]|nr:HTH-type transcriptional activator RhaS [Pseudomonadales bacterium]